MITYSSTQMDIFWLILLNDFEAFSIKKKYVKRNKHGKKDISKGVLIVDFLINISRFIFHVTLQETFCKLFEL